MQKGFTLVETLLYIAVIGGVSATFVNFSLSIASSGAKTYVTQEVHANGRLAVDLVSQRIRAATGVNTGSSTFDSDPGVLSLAMAEAAKNPTIISLSGDDGVLRIKEGSNDAVSVTSSQTKMTNLTFTNLTATGARSNIRMQMTIEYDNPSGDVEYGYSQSLQTAVSVRQ